MTERCFVCGRKLPKASAVVYCDDDQAPAVGLDCRSEVIATGKQGLDTNGGPRVWAFKEWTPSARNGKN